MASGVRREFWLLFSPFPSTHSALGIGCSGEVIRRRQFPPPFFFSAPSFFPQLTTRSIDE